MERAVIYCRKSEEWKDRNDVSFEDQENDTRQYAEQRGYQVVKSYRESHSGADLRNRALIWEAMDDIRAGRADILLVRNYDRLARKPEHQGVILYEVEEVAHGRVEARWNPTTPTTRWRRPCAVSWRSWPMPNASTPSRG